MTGTFSSFTTAGAFSEAVEAARRADARERRNAARQAPQATAFDSQAKPLVARLWARLSIVRRSEQVAAE